jgi:YesN/AraC family two-component response regulator
MSPDVLITDVVMPLLSGIELAIQMREHRPECKVLLFSG